MAQAVPDPFLQDGLDRWEVFVVDSGCSEIFQVLRCIHCSRIRSGSLAHGLEVLGWKLVHHHATVFAVRDLSDQ